MVINILKKNNFKHSVFIKSKIKKQYNMPYCCIGYHFPFAKFYQLIFNHNLKMSEISNYYSNLKYINIDNNNKNNYYNLNINNINYFTIVRNPYTRFLSEYTFDSLPNRKTEFKRMKKFYIF